MRVTTCGTLNTCLAIWEAMMLRLSPSVTATKPSAFSMPARRRTSTSVPLPTTWSPRKSRVSTPREAAREKALGSRSTITTSWPALSMLAAICEPTRPHPTISSFEVNRSLPLGAVLDDVVDRGEKILDEVEKLASASQLPVETELVQARDTGPALVDEAVEWGADLIVMGLPYKRRFGEFNLGKTVPYVLKNATCRVMLFREHREHREEAL